VADPDRRRRSRRGRLLDALIWGAALGAASGAVLGDAIDEIGAGAGAIIGAVLVASAEAISSTRRAPGELQPLWNRILSSVLLMARFGWLLGLIYGPDRPFPTAPMPPEIRRRMGQSPPGARSRLDGVSFIRHGGRPHGGGPTRRRSGLRAVGTVHMGEGPILPRPSFVPLGRQGQV
jgi:hypothetical protein